MGGEKTKGVLWHASKHLYSAFLFNTQFLSSGITTKQVFTFKVYIMWRVDTSNSEINLKTLTEQETRKENFGVTLKYRMKIKM